MGTSHYCCWMTYRPRASRRPNSAKISARPIRNISAIQSLPSSCEAFRTLTCMLAERACKSTAKPQDVVLLRDSGQGKPVVTKLDLEDVLKRGTEDVVLRPF